MAVNVPFGDPDARGTFCDTLTWTRFRGRSNLKKKPRRNLNYIPSEKQDNCKKAMSLLAESWNYLSPLWKGKWNDYGETVNKSGYIAYTSRGMDAYIVQLGSDTTPVSVRAVGVQPHEVWFWT